MKYMERRGSGLRKFWLFCIESKSKKELASFCGFKDLRNFTLKHINPFGYKKTPKNLDFPGFVNIIRLSLSSSRLSLCKTVERDELL